MIEGIMEAVLMQTRKMPEVNKLPALLVGGPRLRADQVMRDHSISTDRIQLVLYPHP